VRELKSAQTKRPSSNTSGAAKGKTARARSQSDDERTWEELEILLQTGAISREEHERRLREIYPNIRFHTVSLSSVVVSTDEAKVELPSFRDHPDLADFVAKIDEDSAIARQRLLHLAEALGRLVGWLRRLPWYAIPTLVIVLSLLVVGLQLAHRSQVHVPMQELSSVGR
jgi:hypothetical protein